MNFKLPYLLLLCFIVFSFPPLIAQKHKTTKNGTNIEILLGTGTLGNSEIETYDRNSIYSSNGLSFGFKLGNMYFFGDESNETKLGLNMIWGSIHGTLTDVGAIHGMGISPQIWNISAVNPGLVFATTFSDRSGLSANFNIGPNLMAITSANRTGSSRGWGLRFGPQVRFHSGALVLGLEYRYANVMPENVDITDNYSSIFGFTVGFKL